MNIDPEISDVTIVLVGSLNPRVFTPDWFAMRDLLSRQEADAAEIDIIHQQIAAFHTDWLSVRVETECPSGDFMSRMNRLSGGPS